jgi:membrane protease YdiL (CAAX protease family)
VVKIPLSFQRRALGLLRCSVLERPPDLDDEQPPVERPSLLVPRIVAVFEVLLCSGYPTQVALGRTFVAFGYGPFNANGNLSTAYVVGVSLVDALLILGLVFLFLYSHHERPRDVFVGPRPVVQEIAVGIPLIVVALGIAFGVLLLVQLVMPRLHTVATNPLQSMLESPRDAWLFALVVIAAGGVREEVQRAFILHRFEGWLGGGTVGLIVTSIAFGSGHLLQGADAALATGLLGAFWGFVYLRRRSVVAPIVSHAGFDLLQIVQFLVARTRA